ncbi:MAG: hypothetical protein BGO78_04430 [Chloroflexi bacterium 44-23]|nr:MAG: hypothetical protein BGO78_04430 [Chloroflexi bacterium 44-23]
MTEIPSWGLALVYWLHLLATVAWVGGAVSLSMIFIPAIQKLTDQAQKDILYREIQKRFQPIGWLALAILFGTGLIQMTSHPSYNGFLQINNSWSVAIFSKHIAILVLIGSMAIMTWGVLPELKKINLKKSVGKNVSQDEINKYDRREKLLVNLNLVLSLIVLLLTAWARSVS